jgi:Zn-dependent metalloprotease
MTLQGISQSGVLNRFYLDDRKSGTNDIGNSYNVTGINIDKAAKIAYRLVFILSANSTYANARTYGIQSATDLYGAGLLKLSPQMHFMQ